VIINILICRLLIINFLPDHNLLCNIMSIPAEIFSTELLLLSLSRVEVISQSGEMISHRLSEMWINEMPTPAAG
jgi:hypothetical protein